MLDLITCLVAILVLIGIALLIYKFITSSFSLLRGLFTKFQTNNDEIAKQNLIDDINDTEETLYIYSGKCDENVFNDKDVEKALDNKKDDIDVVIIIENDLTISNKVQKYLDTELITKMFRANKKYPYHFRVVDNKRVFIERHNKDSREFIVEKEIRYVVHFKRIFYKLYENMEKIAA
jgi:hypothetical protein